MVITGVEFTNCQICQVRIYQLKDLAVSCNAQTDLVTCISLKSFFTKLKKLFQVRKHVIDQYLHLLTLKRKYPN